jgi:hypothetical protein
MANLQVFISNIWHATGWEGVISLSELEFSLDDGATVLACNAGSTYAVTNPIAGDFLDLFDGVLGDVTWDISISRLEMVVSLVIPDNINVLTTPLSIRQRANSTDIYQQINSARFSLVTIGGNYDGVAADVHNGYIATGAAVNTFSSWLPLDTGYYSLQNIPTTPLVFVDNLKIPIAAGKPPAQNWVPVDSGNHPLAAVDGYCHSENLFVIPVTVVDDATDVPLSPVLQGYITGFDTRSDAYRNDRVYLDTNLQSASFPVGSALSCRVTARHLNYGLPGHQRFNCPSRFTVYNQFIIRPNVEYVNVYAETAEDITIELPAGSECRNAHFLEIVIADINLNSPIVSVDPFGYEGLQWVANNPPAFDGVDGLMRITLHRTVIPDALSVIWLGSWAFFTFPPMGP